MGYDPNKSTTFSKATQAPQSASGYTPRQPAQVAQPMPQLAPGSYERGADYGALVQEGFVDDPVSKIKIFASQRFPDMPIEEAVSRYHIFDKDGAPQIGYTMGELDQQGNPIYYPEKPGFMQSPMHAALDVASWAPSGIPQLAGEAAAATRVGAEALKKAPFPHPAAKAAAYTGGAMVGGALAGATAESLKQGAGKAIYGDDFDLLPVGEAAKWAAFGEFLGPVMSKGAGYMFGNKKPMDLSRINEIDVDDLMRKAEQFGITLTPAELSNAVELKSMQRILSQHPASMGEMQEFFDTRNEQLLTAMNDLISSVSPYDDLLEGGGAAFKAAQKRRQDLIDARSDAVSDLYNAGRGLDVAPARVSSIRDGLEMLASDSGAAKQRLLGQLADKLINPDTGKVYNKAGQLHDVRMELDGLLENKSLPKWKAGVISKMRGEIDALLKEFPEYKKADKVFSEMSKPIEKIESLIGPKLIRAGDDDAATAIMTRIFGSKSSPQRVASARKIFEEAGELDKWDGLVQGWLEDRLISMPGRIDANTPMDFRKVLIGNTPKKDIPKLKAALGEEKFSQMMDMADLLSALAKMPKAGSPTAPNLWNVEEVNKWGGGLSKEQLAKNAANLVQSINVLKWPQRISDAAQEKIFEENMQSLARIFTSPEGYTKLKREIDMLRKLEDSANMTSTQRIVAPALIKMAAMIATEDAPVSEESTGFMRMPM